MAIKKTIDIDINTNADEAAKEFDKFGKAVNTADKSVTDLNKTFEEVYGELQPLTTRMGEAEDRLYELAAAGDTASAEYQGLLQNVGEYRKVQIQTDLAVDAAATTMGQKLGGALGGATAGFSAVQGVMGLVGGESEELEKALLKVQSALAIQQGVQGIREAIPAFKQLGTSAKKALKGIKTGIAATGVGVLLVAVGAIVAYWDEITELLGVNNESLEEQLELEKQISEEKAKQKSEMQQTIQDNNKFIKRRIEILKLEEDIKDLSIDQEKNADEIFKKQIEINNLKQSQIRVELFSLDGLLTKQEKINLQIQEQTLIREEQRLIAKKTFDDAKKAEEAAAERRKKRIDDAKKLAELEEQRIQNLINLENEYLDELARIQEENFKRTQSIRQNEEQAVRDKYFTLETLAADNAEQLKIIETAKLNELNDIRLKYDDIANADRITKQDAIYALELELLEEGQAKELQILINGYDEKFLLAEGNAILTEQLTLDMETNIAAIEKKFRDEKEDAEKKQAAADKQRRLDNETYAIGAATNTFTTIANLAELFAGESEESQRKAFKIQKAANIAQATIDTYTSAIGAYRSQASIPVVGPVLGGLAAAAAVTAGLLNIKSISQQQFGGDTGPEPAVPGAIGEPSAPNFNVVGDSGVNQLATLQQQPTQAYVVSGEVTTAQALDRNRVQNATL